MKILDIKLHIQHKALALNKKTKTYLLLAAVLGIWGTIAYKIITGLNSELPTVEPLEMVSDFNPKADISKETFTIKPIERDPFLGTLYQKKQKTTSKGALKATSVTFPLISYQGMIKKRKAKDKVFIININQKQHLLKIGQTRDSITLIKGSAKEIQLRYRNQYKVFKQ